MTHGLKILFLVNWAEGGSWPFLKAVAPYLAKADLLHARTFAHPPVSRVNPYSVKGSEFYLPLKALAMRRHYDLIVSWSLRMGMVYGLLNRIAGAKRGGLHVVQDFHVNPLRHDPAYRLRLQWLRLARPGIGFYWCTSSEEEVLYAQVFDIPRERLRFLPQAPPDRYLGYPILQHQDYVFAYGNSDRSFETLIRACADMKITVRILSQRYAPGGSLPKNVELIQSRMPEAELMRLAAQARLIVIPLQDYRIAAGQLSMLEAMALGKPVVVTENLATKEYAMHGETALFFTAGDTHGLRHNIQSLLESPHLAEAMGAKARMAVSTLHERRIAIFRDTVLEMAR